MTTEKSFWNVSDVCEYLGVKVATLYGWVEHRSIPHYRLGRLIKFKREDIDEWLEKYKKTRAVDTTAIRILPHTGSKANGDIDALVRKTIAEIKREEYAPDHGKLDRVKGLGKEVSDGSL